GENHRRDCRHPKVNARNGGTGWIAWLRDQTYQRRRIAERRELCPREAALMIRLTERQADALTELVNIAFGLTAAKLSEISGYRVLLEAPVIDIHPMDALVRELGVFVTGEVATVHQVFTGPVSGDAILFL